MTRQGRLGNRSINRHRTYSDSGRARDWGSAVVVALVLSVAVVVAAIAIAVYDNSALVASHSSSTTSEPQTTGQGSGGPGAPSRIAG
jgi:2-methylcitrate dehydratase PrpD